MEKKADREPGRALTETDHLSQAHTLASYERIPYRSIAWTSGQPALLEALARLHRLAIAPADACQMIELGCGDGGNLIPLAIAHPKSEFVGIDLVAGHIASARDLVARLGLRNIRFETASFVELPEEPGRFDYVLAHGLLSWVTPNLQEALFAECKRLLAPTGIAFLSYNTYPGWYMLGAIRQLLREHNRGVDDIEQRIARSRQLLEVLLATVPENEVGYRQHLDGVARVAANPDMKYYFAHEYLEEENHPFYLRDFVARIGEHGLRYLADADWIDSERESISAAARGLLDELAQERIEALQVLDYAMNRKFRQSVVCHAAADSRDTPDLAVVRDMWVRSKLSPATQDYRVEDESAISFQDKLGRVVEVDAPLVKAALIQPHEQSPYPIRFEALVRWAEERSGSTPADGDQREARRDALAEVIGRLQLADMLELRACAPIWVERAGERPVASPLARLDAEVGRATTSLRHHTLDLDHEAVRKVLRRLDGTRDRAALLADPEVGLPAEELEKVLTLAAANAVLLA